MIRDNKGELRPVDWEIALITVAKVMKNAGNMLIPVTDLLVTDLAF